jgi:hypothetical protein
LKRESDRREANVDAEPEGTGGSKGRIALAAGIALLVALAVVGALLVTSRGDSQAAPAHARGTPKLSAAEIYPSLAGPKSPPGRPDYRELFVTGQTLAQVVEPACPRYRSVRRAWWGRGQRLRSESIGADASPKAAARYYAGVVWVSQDEAGEFRRAITRISRSRVSAATGGAIKRGFVVNVFTTDALGLCGLTEPYRRTYATLDRLDLRISRIIALARRNASSGTEANNAQ